VKRNLSGFLLVLFLFVMPSFVFSEEAKDGDPSLATLDEVVVSATKTEEKRKDVSNSVIALDSDDILVSQARTLGDFLGNELGIDLRTRGDYGGASEEFQIRGMHSGATQVLVNGLVVNSPSLGSADVSGIPLNSIDNIEIVKGPGSLLYGSNAMAGTINIVTKRPEKGETDLNIKSGYGRHETYDISVEQGMFFLGDLGYYLTATKRDTDGFRNNSDLNHKDISLNLVYDKGDALDISLYGDYIDRKFGRPGPKPPKGTRPFLNLYDDEAANLLSSGADENGHLVINIKNRPLEWLGCNLKGSYMNMENYNYGRYYTTFPAPGMPGSKTWVTNEVLAAEANTEIKPIDALKVMLGGDYKQYDWENENINLDGDGGEIAASKTSVDEDLHTSGVFAEAQYRPCQYFKAIAGIRREDHSEFGSETVPRYGVIVNPHDSTSLKFNYGKHYNAPTPNDLFWPFEDWGFGMGAQGNPNLEPETGKHGDVGIEQSFLEDKVFFNITYYWWDIKDKIRWVPDASFFYRPQNLDTYTGTGWEIGSQVGPYYDMKLALSYTYSDAEEELDGGISRQAQYTADHYLKCGLTYWHDIGFSASATFRYTGERPGFYLLSTDKNPDVELPSYYTFDLKLEQRLFDHWILSLQGNNLFDEEYDTYVESFRDQISGVTTRAGYPGAGRFVYFDVAYEF